MKKKFLTGLLLLAVAAGGVGTFTSCKDTNEDLYAQLRGENATLRADLLKEIADKCEEFNQKLALYALKTDLDKYALKDDLKYGSANDLIRAWITQWTADNGATGLKETIKKFLDELKNQGYFGGGSDCNCQLKDLTAQQKADLLAILTNAQALFGPNFDGKGGLMGKFDTELNRLKALLEGDENNQGALKDIQDLWNAVFGEGGGPNNAGGLTDELKKITEQLNGKDGQSGLSAWFDNFKDLDGNPMTVANFQLYVQQGQYVLNNKAALDKLKELFENGTLGSLDKASLDKLKELYDNGTLGSLDKASLDKLKELFDNGTLSALNKAAIEELNKYYANLKGFDDMYNAIFKDAKLPEGETAWWNYGEVMQNIIKNTKAIEALQDDVDALLNRLNDMVTSLILQAANNMVYPAFNTPFGLNSMVLMTYYGNLSVDIESFPVSNAKSMGAEMYADYNVDWNSLTSNNYTLTSKKLATLAEGSEDAAALGTLWFTVNPGTVNNLKKDGFDLVNSRDEASKVTLNNVAKDDETLFTFGMGSRAEGNGNGLYKAEASVALDDLDEIKVNIEPNLLNALKDAVRDHRGSDMVYLLKVINQQLQNVCVANALRYTYNPATKRDENGKLVADEENPTKVYSNYGLAATAFKPLSFATLKGESLGKHLPTFGQIEISKDLVNLDLEPFGVDGNNFKLNLNFGQPEFKNNGDMIVKTTITLYDKDGDPISGEVEINIKDQTDAIFNDITGAIDEWLNGKDGSPSLDARVEKSIWLALFNDPKAVNPKYPYDPTLPVGVVADLIKQVNDMTTKIQDKLNNLVDQINRDYLGKVNNLIGKYNSVAERINGMLDNPNHYMQVVMFFRRSDDTLGFISTNAKQPTQVKLDGGDAVKLYATTYNFETLCPTFKKIVGVTKVTDESGNEVAAAKANANAELAKVVNGDCNEFALNVADAKGKVYTYEIAYQALDYSGYTSTVKTYIQVLGK